MHVNHRSDMKIYESYMGASEEMGSGTFGRRSQSQLVC